MSKLEPDLDMASAFLLDLGGPDAEFAFQVFPDKKDATGVKRTWKCGTLEEHADWLEASNNAGAGIFVMVNEGDGKGRSTQNVTRVRALFVDLDGAPIEPVLKAEPRPPIVVESSPDRFHAYWPVNDCSLEEFKPLQQFLAGRFDGDTSVCDLPRVMRLPGFWHLKAEPFLTRRVTQ
ncbi:MAG: DNA-primase RepB domain-containing protein [Pseudomonadota bacterium]